MEMFCWKVVIEFGDACSGELSAMACWSFESVAWLVMIHRGMGVPARLDQVRFSAMRRSRKEILSKTGTRAFTTPPILVAMPPARTTNASCPLAMASSPILASRAASWDEGSGGLEMSVGCGGWTVPVTRLIESDCALMDADSLLKSCSLNPFWLRMVSTSFGRARSSSIAGAAVNSGVDVVAAMLVSIVLGIGTCLSVWDGFIRVAMVADQLNY